MNNSKEQTGKEGMSAEEILVSIKNIIAVDNGYSDWDQFLRVDPDGALDTIDTVSQVFSECRSIGTQERIAELEAELKRKDEALEWIEIKSYHDFPKKFGHVLIYGKFTKDSPKRVYQALFNNKTNKFYSDGVLSKEVTHWKPIPESPIEIAEQALKPKDR